MLCQVCGENAVISSAGGIFCKGHFLEYFENTVLDTISKYTLIRPHEKIAVANSGGKDSLSLLYVLNKFFKNSNDIFSVTIDEGIEGYRDKTIDTMKHYCKEWGISYKIYSYKDFTTKSLDDITKIRGGIPCSYCGTLRRYLLNKTALDAGADKVATAHNLDDEAESVLMNLIQNDRNRFLRTGPNVGLVDDEKFVPRIKPFAFIGEKETMLYSILIGINAIHSECPYAKLGMRSTISEIVKEIEASHRGGKKNIVECSLSMRDSLRGNTRNISLNECRLCGAPSSKEVCETCSIKLSLLASM